MRRLRVLMVTYGGGHATMVAPVAAALRARGHTEVTVVGLTTACGPLGRFDVPFHGFAAYLAAEDRAARRFGELLAARMHSEHTGIPRAESVAYLGLSYADLRRRVGPAQAARMFRENGRMAFLPLSVMERIFDATRPDVVVTTNSPRSELAARRLAKARGIPSIAMIDTPSDYLAHEVRADTFVVCSQLTADAYAGFAMAACERMEIVGNPAMDEMLKARGRPDPERQQRLYPGLTSGRKVVMIAEQYAYIKPEPRVFVRFTPEEIVRHLDIVWEATRPSGAALVVRPHPSLSLDLYRQWVARQPAGDCFLSTSGQLVEVLNSIDLLIANNSTIMLNTLYAGRPAIQLFYNGSTTTLPLSKYGVVAAADTSRPAELAATIADLLAPEAASRYRDRFESQFPTEPAAPRIAELIEEQARRQARS